MKKWSRGAAVAGLAAILVGCPEETFRELDWVPLNKADRKKENATVPIVRLEKKGSFLGPGETLARHGSLLQADGSRAFFLIEEKKGGRKIRSVDVASRKIRWECDATALLEELHVALETTFIQAGNEVAIQGFYGLERALRRIGPDGNGRAPLFPLEGERIVTQFLGALPDGRMACLSLDPKPFSADGEPKLEALDVQVNIARPGKPPETSVRLSDILGGAAKVLPLDGAMTSGGIAVLALASPPDLEAKRLVAFDLAGKRKLWEKDVPASVLHVLADGDRFGVQYGAVSIARQPVMVAFAHYGDFEFLSASSGETRYRRTTPAGCHYGMEEEDRPFLFNAFGLDFFQMDLNEKNIDWAIEAVRQGTGKPVWRARFGWPLPHLARLDRRKGRITIVSDSSDGIEFQASNGCPTAIIEAHVTTPHQVGMYSLRWIGGEWLLGADRYEAKASEEPRHEP